jgi:cytochrome c oxidase assembly protein subunit 15
METSLPRSRRFEVSARTFQWLALAGAVSLVVIVASGASVRLTGSGLGCKDWPGCSAGDVFPSAGSHSDIEFSNRVLSGAVIVLTLAAYIGSFLVADLKRWVRWCAAAAFWATFAQAPLGAITVHYHLDPWLVLSHFLVTFVAMTFGVIVALEAYGVRGDPVPGWVRNAALVVGASLAALIVTGTFATAAGPHSGGADVRRLGTLEPAVWLHVRAVAIFGIAFALLIGWLIKAGSEHLRLALVVLGLLIVDMVVGEVQYRTKLPWGLVLAHVTLAAVLWALTVGFVARMWRPRSAA